VKWSIPTQTLAQRYVYVAAVCIQFGRASLTVFSSLAVRLFPCQRLNNLTSPQLTTALRCTLRNLRRPNAVKSVCSYVFGYNKRETQLTRTREETTH